MALEAVPLPDDVPAEFSELWTILQCWVWRFAATMLRKRKRAATATNYIANQGSGESHSEIWRDCSLRW